MNGEQIAFFNYQLAGMLRTGIPLEAALEQLCAGLKQGVWRREMQQLQNDLAQGMPLERALADRHLPPLYIQLVRVGAKTNSLPETLTLAADYFAESHQFWSRFRSVMLYPVIVLSLALAVGLLLLVVQKIGLGMFSDVGATTGLAPPSQRLLWFPPVLILVVLAVLVAIPFVPQLRFAGRWRLPGWKEGTLAQLAASLSLLLRGGIPFPEAIKTVAQLEPYQRARQELARWQTRLAEGTVQFSQIVQGSLLFPPLFIWLVSGAGEDLCAGFDRAAELYRSRSRYRLDLLLYALLPVAALLLGALILTEVVPFLRLVIQFMEAVGEPMA